MMEMSVTANDDTEAMMKMKEEAKKHMMEMHKEAKMMEEAEMEKMIKDSWAKTMAA